MRAALPILVLAALVGAASPAAAQTARSEGPLAPCRPQAMQFDQKLSRMMTPDTPADRFANATQMRNDGMAACQAGRVQEGRQMIQQATEALGA